MSGRACIHHASGQVYRSIPRGVRRSGGEWSGISEALSGQGFPSGRLWRRPANRVDLQLEPDRSATQDMGGPWQVQLEGFASPTLPPGSLRVYGNGGGERVRGRGRRLGMPRSPGSLMSSARCIVFLARGMPRAEGQDAMDASIGCARIACEVSDASPGARPFVGGASCSRRPSPLRPLGGRGCQLGRCATPGPSAAGPAASRPLQSPVSSIKLDCSGGYKGE